MTDTRAGPPVPPDILKTYPRLAQWLRPLPDGRIAATSGKVDIGQGISHALRLIVAEELGVEPEQVQMRLPGTGFSPDEAVTSGSLSVQHSGQALRFAAAHLREACRARLAQKLGQAPEAVRLEDGFFVLGDVREGYGKLFDVAMGEQAIDPEHLAPRPQASAWRDHPREDVAQKVFGEFRYIQDLAPEGMLLGRVLRPGTLEATFDEAAWAHLRPRLEAVDGVTQVVRDGLLVGVLATSMQALRQAGERAAQRPPWRGGVHMPPAPEITAWLKSQPLDETLVRDDPAVADLPSAERHFETEIVRGWLQHGSIGLCCALAQWPPGATGAAPRLQVWSHSQGIFNLRRDLALAFGLEAQDVEVCHAEGAGCYGHNGADDVAFDAAWLARHAQGRPVRVQWSRDEEMAHAPLAPAMAVAVRAAVDAQGRLVDWQQDVWSQGHGTRPGRAGTPALLGAWQTAQPAPVAMAVNAPLASGGGSERNAVPPYRCGRLRVRNHRVLAMPLRVSAMRSLGAHVNVLAAESLIDEIAHALGRDPLDYRLAHLAHDERACAVLRKVRAMADAWPRDAGASAVGRGLGFARYKNTGAWCAVMAEVGIEQHARVHRIWIAADVGRVVHADGARNQIEGGAVQAASWTLIEASRFDSGGVCSKDWTSYPILRFTEAPAVEVELLDNPLQPSLGAGECSAGPTAAALANAIHDALGIRPRALPFDADQLMRAAQAQPG